MKIATFIPKRTLAPVPRVGLVHDGDRRVFDLAAAAEHCGMRSSAITTVQAIIEGGPQALDLLRTLFERHASEPSLSHELAAITLLSPVPVPAQIRDFCIYPDHIRQAIAGMQRVAARLRGEAGPRQVSMPEVPGIFVEQPIYYKCNRFSVVGHEHEIRWPAYSQLLDFELELAIFIGKAGAGIPAQRAREHIFGYSIFNDFSARDAQFVEGQSKFGPAKGKDFDTGNAIGPWLVTADEIADPYGLKMSARVNGETWCDCTSAGALHSFEDMIAHVSRDETLHAGEILGSGTMNTGSGLELGRFLEDGDVVELEVEGIGILRNTVRRPRPA
jgi:2-keto-4-pentenoate hydratase/2-oxohepta-3-ene-1,7-dioic acid hydratase in catechol pathway